MFWLELHRKEVKTRCVGLQQVLAPWPQALEGGFDAVRGSKYLEQPGAAGVSSLDSRAEGLRKRQIGGK